MPQNSAKRKKTVSRKAGKRAGESGQALPPSTDWRTTDEQELLKRRLRAEEESFAITNLDPAHPVFSEFSVRSGSGMTYFVEIRDWTAPAHRCSCTDFRINGLGTCKHAEAVRAHLRKTRREAVRAAEAGGSPRVDIVLAESGDTLKVERNIARLGTSLRSLFDKAGRLDSHADPGAVVARLDRSRSKYLRVSREVRDWLEARAREEERQHSRRDYETGVVEGRHPEHVTLSPLYPYQREGMLHLAFRERALLADEMGLGKTIQAIAACALLHHLGKARRVLVVAPASLKSEWEEQIEKFTELSRRLLFGGRAARLRAYRDPAPPFFTIANYEQILRDSLDINADFRPDIVVLDEAQRIKNWSTKTAQAVKRLRSRYAFVLTGTPIENRLDELYSILDFLDPGLLGPLFRFNREHYELDDKGRPAGYKNLAAFRRKIAPVLLRRRKADVETELPDRSDHNRFVPMTKAMREEHDDYKRQVGDLAAKAKRRPLTAKEQDMLMVLLNMMRMICDSPGILKNNPSRDCPKITELEGLLEESLEEPDVKAVIFSEWTGMLRRVRELADKMGIGYAWHTGSVPQKRRRAEIRAFQSDPNCRLFLSTDSGGVGLNLQNASLVVNCDLPWNPAKLEQRVARVWRKNQRRSVTVLNLVAEESIEHGMLAGLAQKTELSGGVLDGVGDLDRVTLRRGRQAFLKRLEQVLSPGSAGAPATASAPPSDPAAHFARTAGERLGPRLAACRESFLPDSDTSVVTAVVRNPTGQEKPLLRDLFEQTPWRGDKPVLHVVDAATWETLQQLAETGMVTINARGARALLDETDPEGPPPLSAEELAKIKELRATAATKRRAAEALLTAGLHEEAEPFKKAARAAEADADRIERREAPEDAGERKPSGGPPSG